MPARSSSLVTTLAIGAAFTAALFAKPLSIQQSMLSGVVIVDGTNEPAADATVTLIDPSGRRPSRTSNADADGQFRFPGVEAGRYLLSASKVSYISTEYGANQPERIGTPVIVAGGQPLSNLGLTLFRAGVIAGTVWDSDGRPVARAGVSAYRRRHQPGGDAIPVVQGQATTDDRGAYRIFGLPPGEYIVATVATGRGSGSSALPPVLVSTYFPASPQLANAGSVHVDSGDEKSGIDIRANAATTTSLKVNVGGVPKRADGTPLSVRITLTSRDDAAAGAGLRTGTAVDGGGYLFRYLPLGRYRLAASIASAVEDGSTSANLMAESDLDVLSADPPPFEVDLRPGSSLTGVVRFSPQRGSPDVSPSALRVQLRSTEPGGSGVLRAQSPVASDGTFVLRGLAAARYRLDVRPVPSSRSMQVWRTAAIAMDDRPMDSPILDIASGRNNRIVVTLTDDTATLSGSLSAGRAPNAPAPFVVLIPVTSQRFESSAILVVRPASDRSIALAGIRAGDYAVAIVEDFDPDDANNPEALARLKAAATVSLSFTAGEQKQLVLKDRDPAALCGECDAVQATSTYPLARIEATGLHRFTLADATRLSGLKVGQPVGPREIDAAVAQMLSAGVFKAVRYRVANEAGQLALTFEIEEETDWSIPVIFDNFIWMTDDELNAAVREAVPAYDGTAPVASRVPEIIARALTGVLRQHKTAGEVEYRTAGKQDGSDRRHVFTVSGALPTCALHIEGATKIKEADLLKIVPNLVRQPYSRSYLAEVSQKSLKLAYQRRGYWRATFQAPVATPGAVGTCTGALATIHVDEGIAYRFGPNEWIGNTAIGKSALDRLLGVQSEVLQEPLTMRIRLAAIHDAYQRLGYLQQAAKIEPVFDDATGRVHIRGTIVEGKRASINRSI